jgi:hypothetical protein
MIKVTAVNVRTELDVDLGFRPYLAYLKELGGRPAPFGTREQSKASVSVYMTAEVEEGQDADEVAAVLTRKTQTAVRTAVRNAYAKILGMAEQVEEVPSDAFMIETTSVEPVTEEF